MKPLHPSQQGKANRPTGKPLSTSAEGTLVEKNCALQESGTFVVGQEIQPRGASLRMEREETSADERHSDLLNGVGRLSDEQYSAC